MFFPSHFLPYKNHRLLLTAYGMYVSRFPEDKIDLVLAGAPDSAARDLKLAVKKMGLSKRVHFFGSLPSKKLASLWNKCEYIIFPSLYEYFIPCPIIKAMCLGKPILCSNLDSIRTIAKDAAIYFNARKPEEIIKCIHGITSKPENAVGLINRGRYIINNLLKTDKSKNIMNSCWDVLSDKQEMNTSLAGIYEDGWTGGEFTLFFESGQKDRFVELRFEAPSWLPADKVCIELYDKTGKLYSHNIYRGNEMTIRHALPDSPGSFNFLINPVFRPTENNLESNDHRYLGIILKECWIVSGDQDWSSVKIKKDYE